MIYEQIKESGNAGYVTVPIISIDEFLAESGRSRPICLIKIDVQGYELAVCRGMGATIAQQRSTAVAVEYMPEAMRDLGYDAEAMLDWFARESSGCIPWGRRVSLPRA